MSNAQNPPSSPSGAPPPGATVIGNPPLSGTFVPAPEPLAGAQYPAPQPAYPQEPGPPPPAAGFQPVPPVSLHIPPSRPARPPRGPLVRLLVWLSEPSMIKGMAMGVVLALVISVAFRVEAMWFVASGVLTLLITCLFGVLIGHYVFENRRKRLQHNSLEVLREAGGELPGLGERLFSLAWTRDTSQLPDLWDRLRRFRPAAEQVAGITVAAAFRVMAMSTLFAVLGGAISFAVFLTSFMQVERMDAQNALIDQQIKQTSEQMHFAELSQQIEVALSIAERRQVTVRELLAVINSDTKPGAKLSKQTANLISVAVEQLEPYVGVTVDRETGKNVMSAEVKSPEQEQLLRYLSAAHLDLGELDLSSAFLDHVDLHGREFQHIALPGVRMRHARLNDANLAAARLPGVDLTRAVLSRADLSGSNLNAAVLHRANLVDADLKDADLVDADLRGAVLTGAVLQQTRLGRASLHGARLTRCDLSSAELTDTDLALADLSEATLPQVPRVRAAGFWWLGVYAPDYAAKLGLDAEAQQRNRAAFERLHATPLDAAGIAALVQELKVLAPSAPV